MRQLRKQQSFTDRRTESMACYLREISARPLITAEEEVRLARLIKKGGKEGEKAKAKLVEANLRFVISVANQYHQKNLDLGDLISEGNIGLIKAAERFDDTRGFKFASYAVWWIRQAISAAILDKAETVRLPSNQYALLQKYKAFWNISMQENHRPPTVDEFAEYANIDARQAKKVIGYTTGTISMDTPLADDSDCSYGDLMASNDSADSDVEQQSLHTDLYDALNNLLDNKERDVLMRYYGLKGKEETLDMISMDINMSHERVRQIREKALLKLKKSPQSYLLARYLCAS